MNLNMDNLKYEFLDDADYAEYCTNGFDLITSIKRETCSDSEESGTEDQTEIKCEYLEYDNELSDNESNASRHSLDHNQQHITIDDNSDLIVHDNINKFGKHEDLFMIIVSDTKKKKNSSKTVVKKKKFVECEYCNRAFSTSYYSDHMKRLHGDKKLKAKAAQISAIKRKLKSTKVICPICQKIVSKVNYKPHFATHDPNKSKFICDVCGKGFAQKRFLVIHMVVHSTEFKFGCKQCPYKGRSSNHLRMHMKVHSMDYKYLCNQCPAKFLTNSNLKKHLQVHSKREMKFFCETCQKRFKSKITLERHIEVSHLGILKHICDICGIPFGYRKSLMEHQVMVHKKPKQPHGRLPSYLKAKLEATNSA